MKLYMHPVSMTSRPVSLFIAENKLACEQEVVDLMKGAHHQEPYAVAQSEPAGADAGRTATSSSPKARRS